MKYKQGTPSQPNGRRRPTGTAGPRETGGLRHLTERTPPQEHAALPGVRSLRSHKARSPNRTELTRNQ